MGYIYVMKEIALRIFKFRNDQSMRVPDYIRGLKKVLRKRSDQKPIQALQEQGPKSQ